jgi:hypothetical protein
MKNTTIKLPALLLICFFAVAMTSCAPQNFQSRKHQHRHFFGEKHKQKSKTSVASLEANIIYDDNTEASLEFNNEEIN